ncbi:MAG: META domain-containing protein [Anaerolineales bacterium]|nr:META domain-containing protein [Anaerolineales bacterium]MCB0026613.1 META domain-containing protein [Anaerolineales bacterium]
MMKNKTTLLLFLALLFSLVACNATDVNEGGSETATTVPTEPTKSPTETAAETPFELTDDLLKNMSYQGIFDEPVTLADGLYEGEPFVEGGASKPTVTLFPMTALGDLNNNGVDDAAVLLVENSGGTGSFVYLAAVLNSEGTPENVSTLLLGDRVSPESVMIAHGEIVVEAETHAEDDPLCCPSLKTRTTYTLQNGALITVNTEYLTERKETTVPDELLGTWYWLAFQDSADGAESNDIIVSDPSNYGLEFLVDGTAQIQADCNSGSSQLTLEDNSLTFAPGPMTLAECEPGSLYNEYLARLGDVVTYVIDDDGNLVLNLKMDAGNMIFSREARPLNTTLPLDKLNIQLDAQGVAASWNWQVVFDTPYDQSMPPGPVGLPAHIELLFDAADQAEHLPGDPILYLIPVEAYQQMWDEAGNTAVANILAHIADRTYITNMPGSVTALPFEEIGGIKDLTTQLGRAVPFGHLNETSAAQSGYRFVGRWTQDANPLTNQGLTYVYQGFTNDGRFLVSFFYPITTEALPAIEDVPQEEFDRLANDYDAYMADKTDLLNSLDSADFTPTLDALDALVASLEIAGMPLSGLLDKTWQWTGGPAQPGSSEIITIEKPQLYQVTYRSDGTIEIIADCNQASMSYELSQGGLNGSMLATPGPMTLVECGPDSHYQAFINSLEATQGYRVHPGGNELSLILPAGGGILTFVAVP